VFSIVLQPRSLLVFKDDLYVKYLHGIAFQEKDVVDAKTINLKQVQMKEGDVIERKRRVSFTIRLVNKVLKNTIKLH
jgi:alkylated DNA repair protein alkB family protein 6